MPTVTRRIKKKPGKPGWWSEEQRIDAVAKYLILGNLSEVARETKIPRDTLNGWKQKDWWGEVEADIRKQTNQTLQGKLGKIIDKSLSTVEERLDKGDFVYDPKSGSIKRIGVKASVANQITKDSIDRKVLLEKISTRGTNSEEAVAERLASLRQEFLKFVNSKQISAKEEITTYQALPEPQPEVKNESVREG